MAPGVRFSAAARAAIAAALALTLGVKAAWTRDAPAADSSLFTGRAEAMLSDGGFATRRYVRPFGTLVLGRKDNCRLMVADYAPHGTLAEPIAAYARSIGPLRFRWRGDTTEEPPKLAPLASFYLERELRRVGLRPVRQPIIAVAASEGCELDSLPWHQLARLPR